MKALSLKLTAAAAVLAVVFAPVASAKSGARVKLSVLPLPASVIGQAARALPLQTDSGPASNTVAARRGVRVTPTHSWVGLPSAVVAKRGRLRGYALDYGQGASGGAGVTEVWTSVDEYKTGSDARKGLALWKLEDRHLPPGLDRAGLAVAVKPEKTGSLGGGRFAFLVSYRAANISPVFGLDEQFTEGRYEADVNVWAGSSAAAKTLAPTLAKKLHARIKLALQGKLHARPVKLPAKQKPGPPPGGPDLTALALKTTDFSPAATLSGQFYTVDGLDPTAVSDLRVDFFPGGQFGGLSQEIEWCPTANQASFVADLSLALDAGPDAIPVDLSSVGDGARGFHSSGTPLVDPSGVGFVTLSSGRLVEWLVVLGSSVPPSHKLQASDVQEIAQRAANHINAAGLGS